MVAHVFSWVGSTFEIGAAWMGSQTTVWEQYTNTSKQYIYIQPN